jgi:23S rRNA (uracil1939-C5)-methyltransferase/tRNA (uracil-5-)-methyltransferase
MKKKEILTIPITDIAYGGKGIARKADGKVIFVPHTLTGEIVEITIKRQFTDYDEGEIVKIVKPSPKRIQSNCMVYAGTDVMGKIHYTRTPGCVYQDFSYSEELNTKEKQFTNFLNEFCDNFLPTIQSPKQLHYRNKIILHAMNDHGDITLGYREEKGSDVIDIKQCPLAKDEINEKLQEIRNKQGFFSSLHDGMTLTLRKDQNQVNWWRNAPSQKASWLKEQTIIGSMSVPMGGFFQINNDVTDILIEKVIEAIKAFAPKSLIDLYCGCGLFSLAAYAAGVNKISGIDCVEQAIAAAQYNAKQHNIPSAIFTANSADKGFESLMEQHEKNFNTKISDTVLIVDPPRNGMGRNVRKLIRKTDFKGIIYISCAPDTLRRDLKILRSTGYVVKSAQMFDMFPRTAHFESMVVLER